MLLSAYTEELVHLLSLRSFIKSALCIINLMAPLRNMATVKVLISEFLSAYGLWDEATLGIATVHPVYGPDHGKVAVLITMLP